MTNNPLNSNDEFADQFQQARTALARQDEAKQNAELAKSGAQLDRSIALAGRLQQLTRAANGQTQFSAPSETPRLARRPAPTRRQSPSAMDERTNERASQIAHYRQIAEQVAGDAFRQGEPERPKIMNLF